MNHRSRSRGDELIAVETGDGERVECDGVLDLLDQFCTSVNDERTPHRAILVHLEGAFEQVLQGNASLDEALGLKRDRPGRPPRSKIRNVLPDNAKAREAFWRDRRLALWVSQHIQNGKTITRAYEHAMKMEMEKHKKPVSLSTVRRAWKKYSDVHQWIQHLEPARRMLTMESCQRAHRRIMKDIPKVEKKVARLQQTRHLLALQAARLCGLAYGQAAGADEKGLIEELLWDPKQLLGPRQYLHEFLKIELMTEEEARTHWRHGYREGASQAD